MAGAPTGSCTSSPLRGRWTGAGEGARAHPHGDAHHRQGLRGQRHPRAFRAAINIDREEGRTSGQQAVNFSGSGAQVRTAVALVRQPLDEIAQEAQL